MGVKNRMIDFLMEAARGAATVADLQEKVADPTAVARAEALKLDSTDFADASPGTRIGVAYLKGRMQNLEEELAAAQAYGVDMRTKLNTEMTEHGRTKWQLSDAQWEIAALKEKYEPEEPEELEDFGD